MCVYLNSGCVYLNKALHIVSVRVDKPLALGLSLRATVSPPSDTVSLGEEHIGQFGNRQHIFSPGIFQIECTLTWRYIKTLLVKVSRDLF